MLVRKIPMNWTACAVLSALGFLGNLLKLTIIFNVDFLPGSFFVMLAVIMVGRIEGVIAGVVASTCTILLWHHPWAMVTFSAEALFVATLYTRRRGSPVLYDIAFWVCAGIPLIFLIHYFITQMPIQSVLLIALKQSINGVFNTVMAMLASILIKSWQGSSRERVNYSQLIFAVMVSLVLLPSTYLFITGLKTYQEKRKESLEAKISYIFKAAQTNLEGWIAEHRRNIRTLSSLVGNPETIPFDRMRLYLEIMQEASPAFEKVGILDRHAIVVATFPPGDNDKSMVGIDFSDRPYVALAKTGDRPRISEVLSQSPWHPSPAVLFLAPIIVSGEYGGVCAGAMDVSRIAGLLNNMGDVTVHVTVVDGSNRVIATTQPNLGVMDPYPRDYGRYGKTGSGKVTHWMPDPEPHANVMQKWMDTYLLKAGSLGDDCDWRVIADASYLPLVADISGYGIHRLTILGCLILLTILLSHFLSRGFISTVVKLQSLTGSLPRRLEEVADMAWPKSRIEELAALSDNIQEMALALVHDISRRRTTEGALRLSESKFRSYIESAPFAIFVADREGRFVDCNPATADLLGYDASSLRDLAILDVHPEEFHEKVRQDFAALLREGRLETEVRMTRRDGRPIWVSLHVVMISERLSLGYCLDISSLKQTEEALRESEERFRTIFEQAAVGVAQMDTSTGRFIRVNRKFCDIVGYSEEELLDRNFQVITHPDHVKGDVAMVERLRTGDIGSYSIEKRYIHRNGSTVWASLTVSPIRKEGLRERSHIAIVQDITERKRLEEERARVEAQLRQAQKMESLGTLAGGIAHDFNNILGIITGYTELVRMNAGDGQGLSTDLQEVLRATERAKDLVRQILAFSRQSEQEKRPIQLGPIVKEALKMLRATLPSTIGVEMKVSSDAVVLADPIQIHQVLMNLCTNAAHAMRDTGGDLEVDLEDLLLTPEDSPSLSDLPPGAYVALTVKDTGHGIDPAIQDRIFDPFFTTKEKGVGTGLGLSVVHGIVQSHGGEIRVSSRPGEGSTFHVHLPCLESAPVQETEVASPPPRGKERILVVDDEPALAAAIKHMLERLGYRADFRTNGVDALNAFRGQFGERPFDLVITDMTMPHLTGMDLAKELLEIDPELPVLLCSGFSERADAEKAEGMGIRGFLMKPVGLKDLADMVRKVLDAKTP